MDAWGQKLKEMCGSKTIEEIDGKASVLELAQYEVAHHNTPNTITAFLIVIVQEASVNAAREQKDQELVQYRKVIFVELLLWLLIPLLGRNVREKKAKHWLCWGNAEKKRGKARRYDLAEGRVPKNNKHRVGAKSCGACGCH